MKTKSLSRLERLRKKLGVVGQVTFHPTVPKGDPSRYQCAGAILGKDAQAARKTLKELAVNATSR